ncbi:nuclear transport factor 2 family protein [Mucilaginibacter gynuensis]
MKRLLLASLLFLFACTAFAQDKKTIANVLETQRQAWNRGDLDEFMQQYWKSDSLLFVGKSGPTYGWQQTLDNYKKGYPDKAAMGTLTFKIIKINLIDKTNAFVLGGWNLKREKDSPGGYFTLWFRKINGEWKIVADHSS